MECAEAYGVEPGQSYAVRVRALNAAGHSQWSIESDQLVCRHKSLKPKVVFRGGVKEMTLNAGDTLFLEADIPGEPPCEEIAWTLNGKTLVEGPGNGIYIDNSKPYMSFLEKSAVTRKDCGPVVCTATNMSGKAAATVQLLVVDRPSMPQDRLLISNIHR